MTANMNWRRYVTSMIFPMVFMATITHFTTYYKQGKEIGRRERDKRKKDSQIERNTD